MLNQSTIDNLTVCAREHESMHSVDEFYLVKVDQQCDGYIENLHVAHDLSLMNWQDLLNGLRFDKHTSLDQHIEP